MEREGASDETEGSMSTSSSRCNGPGEEHCSCEWSDCRLSVALFCLCFALFCFCLCLEREGIEQAQADTKREGGEDDGWLAGWLVAGIWLAYTSEVCVSKERDRARLFVTVIVVMG